MEISLNKFCEHLANKLSIDDKNDLLIKAWFPHDDEESMPKNESHPEDFLCSQYAAIPKDRRTMGMEIYYKDLLLFEIDVEDASPLQEDVYKFLDIENNKSCIGPGFYYDFPFFYIDGRQSQIPGKKRNYQNFLRQMKVDTEKMTFESPLTDINSDAINDFDEVAK